MGQHELAHLTWQEAAAARDRGAVVMIPIGTQEQNGVAAPLGSDSLVAFEVARRTAQETGALVAPPINFGYSPQFRNWPGTITLSADTLRVLIVEVCRGLLRNGFERLILVNCHMLNEPIMEHAGRQIREETGVRLGYFNPITLAHGASKDLYAGKEGCFGHGAEPIASILRSFAAESVKLPGAGPTDWRPYHGLPIAGFFNVKVGDGVFGLYLDREDISDTGGNGDPTASDPERGAEIMRRVVTLAAQYVRIFATLPVK